MCDGLTRIVKCKIYGKKSLGKKKRETVVFLFCFNCRPLFRVI